MSDSISNETIKKTQNCLGKYIKKPPLTEKLLTKPPFRFLHDIIMAVVRQTGFLKGLYSTEELLSENVKDRDTKIAFLQKTIDTVKMATSLPLTVRPSKVISGHEPEKTNELLQAIAFAIEHKINSEESVKHIKSILREERRTASPSGKAESAPVPSGSKRSTKDSEKKSVKPELKTKSRESARGEETKKKRDSSRESERMVRKVRENSLEVKKSKTADKNKELKSKSREGKATDSAAIKSKESKDVTPVYMIQTEIVESKEEPDIEETDKAKLRLIRTATRSIVKDETVNEDTKDEVDVEPEVRIRTSKVRSETRSETRNEILNDTRSETKNENRNELQSKSRNESLKETDNDAHSDSLNEKNNAINQGAVRDEMDVRPETRTRSRLRSERSETRGSNNDMRDELRNEKLSTSKLEKLKSSKISDNELKSKDSNQQSSHHKTSALQKQRSEEERSSLINSPVRASPPSLVPSFESSEKPLVATIQPNEHTRREIKIIEKVDEFKLIDNEIIDENSIKEYDSSKPQEDLKVKGRSSRPRTSLRPPSVRPTSARPGAPRIRDKNIDVVIEPDEMVQLGKVNVTLESFNNEDDDELVIIETNEATDKRQEEITLDNKEKYKQGHLVNQILETQKELGDVSSNDKSKTEIEWDPGTRRDKEKSIKDMDMLRSSIQTLARSANPLGKLMDFLQEDVDAMQRELAMWRDNNNHTSEELHQEYRLTEEMIHPLQQQLQQIENNIRDQTEMINSTRANVLRYEDKIHKLLTEY